MAKLTARGRTAQVTMVKEEDVQDDDLVDWRRRTVALMSDGAVLQKYDARFKPTKIFPKPEKHSYGWKVKDKKCRMTTEEFRLHYLALGYSLA